MEFELEKLFSSYIKENQLDLELSYFMPPGYENAFGTFDITVKTLFINKRMLGSRPDYEVLYYFYHELRHAVQYSCPQRFNSSIQKSIHYVILYNGNCFKLINGKWKNCHLSGEEEYFICAYENLPYELDAHEYACNIVKALLPEYQAEIERLYHSWLPQNTFHPYELEEIFRRIDQAI
jgi:hypothetical protein